MEARSLIKPTETRIADYFEVAEIAEQEAESQSRDAAAKQHAKQLYNNASADVTVLLEQADGAKQEDLLSRPLVRMTPRSNIRAKKSPLVCF